MLEDGYMVTLGNTGLSHQDPRGHDYVTGMAHVRIPEDRDSGKSRQASGAFRRQASAAATSALEGLQVVASTGAKWAGHYRWAAFAIGVGVGLGIGLAVTYRGSHRLSWA